MANRKVDSDNIAFQYQWGAEYWFIGIAGKDICLICGANVAEIKKFKKALREKKSRQAEKHNAE